MKDPLFRSITIVLITLSVSFFILVGLVLYQGEVIDNQRKTIRMMMHNPACMTEPPKPVKLETM